MWDVPPPGTAWSTPGAPGAGMPAAPPSGPPLGPAVGSRPPVQRAAHRTQVLAVLVSVGLAIAGLLAVGVVAEVRARSSVFNGITFEDLVAMDRDEVQVVLDDVRAADEQVSGVLGPYVLLTFVTGILWIVWQRRFVRNAMPFGQIPRSIGWGTWGWLVPLANLVLPESQLAQACRLSDPARLRKEGGSGATPFVYLWWGCWTASSILALGGQWTTPSGYELAFGTATLDDFRRADLVLGFAYGLAVPAAIFGILTVLHATKRQREMLHALGVAA